MNDSRGNAIGWIAIAFICAGAGFYAGRVLPADAAREQEIEARGRQIGVLLARTSRIETSIERLNAEGATAASVRGAKAAGPVAPCAVEDAALNDRIARAVRDQSRDGEKNPVEPTPENVKSLEQAHHTIDAAISIGRWRDGDASAIRTALRQLTAEGREEIQVELSVAINSGKLKLETSGPPFQL